MNFFRSMLTSFEDLQEVWAGDPGTEDFTEREWRGKYSNRNTDGNRLNTHKLEVPVYE